MKTAEKRQSLGFEIRRPHLGPSIPAQARIVVVGYLFWGNQIDRLGRKLKQPQLFKDIRRSGYNVALRHFFLPSNSPQAPGLT